MGYYRGDHYRRYAGDYYRGDPGFFSSIGKAIKGAVRVVGGAAMGFITGGGIKGAIGGAVAGTAHAVAAGPREATLEAGGPQPALPPALREAHAPPVSRGSAHGAMIGPPMGPA